MTKYHTEEQINYLLKHNLFGVTSHKQLEQLETVAFSIRSSQLEVEGFDWLFPLTIHTLKQLHFTLFQDVYPFAGEIRDVQLMKGTTRFCQAEYIEENLLELLNRLQNEKQWESIEKSANRLAYYKTELNIIHPFREGNGRTIRIVIREIAKCYGFKWSFENIKQERYMQAMIQSITDESLLKEILEETLHQL